MSRLVLGCLCKLFLGLIFCLSATPLCCVLIELSWSFFIVVELLFCFHGLSLSTVLVLHCVLVLQKLFLWLYAHADHFSFTLSAGVLLCCLCWSGGSAACLFISHRGLVSPAVLNCPLAPMRCVPCLSWWCPCIHFVCKTVFVVLCPVCQTALLFATLFLWWFDDLSVKLLFCFHAEYLLT